MSLKGDSLIPQFGPVWLQVGTLLDGGSDVPVRDGHLVYDGDRILHAGPALPSAAILRDGQTAPDAILPQHTVLPGLIESHAHLMLEGGEEDTARRSDYLKLEEADMLARATTRLQRLLAIGVIAVRDAGDKKGVGLALQKKFRSDDRPLMPYVDSPGAAIHHEKRYGGFMGRPMEEYPTIQTCVDGRIAEGAHRLKLIATGIIDFAKGTVTSKPQMPLGELTEFVMASRARGKQTFAHCSGNDGVSNCIGAGVDSIEHGFFVDDDQLARMRDADIAWVPTFAPVQFQLDQPGILGWDESVCANLQKILDAHAASLVKATELGVRIIAGSDAGSHGVPHGWGFLKELSLMEQAGLSPLQVIHAATGAPATRLEFAEDFGILRVGAKPRFIITEHNPLETVANLAKAKTVIFDGTVLTGPAGSREPGM
jgi:imidazolonepropionase-like amidohydrolase